MNELNETIQKGNRKIMELLKNERVKRNWTYEEVGAKLGVSASYIFRLEKGERANPSSKVIVSMCELFGLNPNEILQMADPKNSIILNGKIIDMGVIQETMNLILHTDVDKMSEVTVLLNRIQHLQADILMEEPIQQNEK